MGKQLQEFLEAKGLSFRERMAVDLVGQGLSNKDVANQMLITEKTTKFHLTNIYKKLNVKSRAQLIVMCLPYMAFFEEVK